MSRQDDPPRRQDAPRQDEPPPRQDAPPPRQDAPPPPLLQKAARFLEKAKSLKIAKEMRSKDFWAGRGLALAILAGGMAIALLLLLTGRSVRPQEVAERSWLVETQRAVFADVRPSLRVFGQVVAGRQIALRALVQGKIVETWTGLREGSIVRQGEPLLRIDPFPYQLALAEARASLAEARARLKEMEARKEQDKIMLTRAKEQLEIRRRDVSRSQRLAKDGNISEQALDNRQLAFSQQAQAAAQAESEIQVQTAKIEQQRAVVERLDAALSQRQRDLENVLLTAPFDGFLRDVKAGTGRFVSPNDPIATLMDAHALEVRFNLSEKQFGELLAGGKRLKGQIARVGWRIGAETLFFDATIARSGARISSQTGGIDLFATLQVPTVETPLRPGAFVEVELPDRLYKDVLRLPERALYQEASHVYVLIGGRLKRRAVRLVGRDGRHALLKSKEILSGDEILTTRFPEAGEGVKAQSVPFSGSK